MNDPKLNPNDTEPANDLRVITPSNDPLSVVPRALYCSVAGNLNITCPDETGLFPVSAGNIYPIRPTKILPDTTAVMVAVY
ncbi:MAG: hypothetical protein AAF376_08890 [Pseudomonadota bacterium]